MEIVVLEFRKMMGEAGKKVSGKQSLEKLDQMQRRDVSTLESIEKRSWRNWSGSMQITWLVRRILRQRSSSISDSFGPFIYLYLIY